MFASNVGRLVRLPPPTCPLIVAIANTGRSMPARKRLLGPSETQPLTSGVTPDSTLWAAPSRQTPTLRAKTGACQNEATGPTPAIHPTSSVRRGFADADPYVIRTSNV